jgi:NAD-dependent dihydropyrimidine dehydrogenase PreA subunit
MLTAQTKWRVDSTKCDGCGGCVVICPVRALGMRKKVPVVVDAASCCRESCRLCEYQCWSGAISAY